MYIVMLVGGLLMLWQAHRNHFSPVGGIVALVAAGLSALRRVVDGEPFLDALGLAASLAFAMSSLLYVLSYRRAIRNGTFRGPLRVVSDKVVDDLERPAS